MGTDRDEILNVPCPCGVGRIIVENCSPDHPWARGHQSWQDARIICVNCEKTFCLFTQENAWRLGSREIHDQIQNAKRGQETKQKELEEALWKRLTSGGDLEAVVTHLNNFTTANAAFRFLLSFNAAYSLEKFRKKFQKRQCTNEWIKTHIHLQSLESILIHIGKPAQVISDYFKDDSAKLAYPIPEMIPIGEPLYRFQPRSEGFQ